MHHKDQEVVSINSRLGRFIYKLPFETKEKYLKNYVSELHILEREIKECTNSRSHIILISKLKRKCRILERINLITFSKYELLLIKHNKFISRKKEIILDIALNIDRPDNLFQFLLTGNFQGGIICQLFHTILQLLQIINTLLNP